MRLNNPVVRPHGSTHEGAPAAPINAEQELRRSVMSCFLWDNEFYEDGEEIGKRIVRLVGAVPASTAAVIAVKARAEGHLRHVPLLIASAMSKAHPGNRIVADTVYQVVQRADELSELLAIHAKLNGVTPDKVKGKIPAQMKKGLARAFTKFNEYALAKYNRDNAIKLRDVLFMVHAKPKDAEQEALWKRLIDGTLATPDTWEVQLSGGADKKETFERLIREGNLGYFALIRNLRNMAQAGCDYSLVANAIRDRKNGADKILPFRFIAAARACPQYEPDLDFALLSGILDLPTLPGMTVVLVDVSGSMDWALSDKSDLRRIDAAAGLGAIWPGSLRLFTFSDRVVEVPPRRGMAGIDAIVKSQPHSSTLLASAIAQINREVKHDRLIVITDEQSHDGIVAPVAKNAYLINVASNQRGVGYGKPWVHIDGFSENTVRYIYEHENSERAGV